MGKYRLTEAAKEDLRRIYRHGFLSFGEAQADEYYDAFFERFEQIAAHPYLYPSVDYIREGYRRSVCRSDSIFYRVVDGTVEIMHIFGRQNIDEML